MTAVKSKSPAPSAAAAKAKSAKALKTKKTTIALKKPKTHPTYSEMIKEAIMALKERSGSSQIAIAKFINEKQKSNLSPNFSKLLLSQLKKLVAAGKLVKVKNSFKIPSKSTVAAGDAKSSAPVKAKADSKPKTKAVLKTKAVPKKKTGEKPKSRKNVKLAVVKSPMKKTKKTPLKGAKKPKSIKTPAKKN